MIFRRIFANPKIFAVPGSGSGPAQKISWFRFRVRVQPNFVDPRGFGSGFGFGSASLIKEHQTLLRYRFFRCIWVFTYYIYVKLLINIFCSIRICRSSFSSGIPTIASTTALGWSLAISGSRPPNFFPWEWGWGSSNFWGPKAPKSGSPRGEGARLTKNFEYFEIFEKKWLKNAIKMNFWDLLNKNFLNFFYKKWLIWL